MPKKSVSGSKKPKGKAAKQKNSSDQVPAKKPSLPKAPTPPRPASNTTKVVVSTSSRSVKSSGPTWLSSLGWSVLFGGLVLYNFTPDGLSLGGSIVNDLGSLDIANPKAWHPATSGDDYLKFVIILVLHLMLLRYMLYRLILNPIAQARKSRKPLPPKASVSELKIVQGQIVPATKSKPVEPEKSTPLVPKHPQISASVSNLQDQMRTIAVLDRLTDQRDQLQACLTEACNATIEYFNGAVADVDVEFFQQLLDTLNASLRYYVRSASRHPSSKIKAGMPDPMAASHERIIAAIEGYADYALRACQRREFPFEEEYVSRTDSLAALRGIELDFSKLDGQSNDDR